VFEHTLTVPMRPRRVVILGSGGFVGRAIRDQLSASGIPMLPNRSTDLDLSSAAAVEQLAALLAPGDVLVMLSAITREKGRDGATFMKNVSMAHHVAAAAAGGCAHLVYVSSDAVYGEEPPLPVTERTSPAPADLYGLAHLTRERLLLEAFAGAATPIAIFRPTMLYGPGDTHRSYGPNRFVRTLLEDGTITLFGDGEETRDYVHVCDFASLVLLSLERRSQGLLNVATGRAVTGRHVVEVLSEVTGRVRSVASEPRAGRITHRAFDISALSAAFPAWRPRPLAEGLRATWAELQ
jgi:nucleoside-diphosphate-sugar epimerase